MTDQRIVHAAGPARRRDRRSFRWTALLALVVAATSAAVFAMLDAATVVSRASGESVDARPMWLHTFSVALMTCAVVAHALWTGTGVGATAARSAYLVTATANATVPVLGLRHDDTHPIVAAVHLTLAALLTAMALLVRRRVESPPHTAGS